jgi:8-oxo-dGTP diphosphatase
VAVVLRDERFLVIRRSAHVVAPGKLCFPGGGIEEAETEVEALVREFREELGAEIEPVGRLWQSTTRWGVELGWWLGEINPGAALEPNPAEVAEILWLTATEMRGERRLLESNQQFLDAIAAGEIVLPAT